MRPREWGVYSDAQSTMDYNYQTLRTTRPCFYTVVAQYALFTPFKYPTQRSTLGYISQMEHDVGENHSTVFISTLYECRNKNV